MMTATPLPDAALRRGSRLLVLAAVLCYTAGICGAQGHSVARQWNEILLECIRNDFAKPTVHARNLFHTSIAMWDSWAVYDDTATPYLTNERADAFFLEDAREETMSYAVARVLRARFADSPGAEDVLPLIEAKMIELGYDPEFEGVVGRSEAALGNRIGLNVLHFGFTDGANERETYADPTGYMTVNPPLIVDLPGNPDIIDPNRWQPVALEFFVDQGGNPIPLGNLEFLTPFWGSVKSFALRQSDFGPNTWYDPGPPPYYGGIGDAEYRDANVEVVMFSSLLDPSFDAMIDISPGGRGNNTLGTNDGTGHPMNPSTGMPYAPLLVRHGDFGRVIAEFWADGPESETPPGHWNVIANYVSDNPSLQRRIGGIGPVVNRLEWDVKLYFGLNAAVHDAGITAWNIKGFYDYLRPISSIRYMAGLGQSSDLGGPSYDAGGIPLVPGVIEVITVASASAGQRHEHLVDYIDEIAFLAWQGNPDNPDTEVGGVGWIRAADWVPYQRSTFVTPPFAGYISGHSTFSRAAAEYMTGITGSMYFPDGLGEFVAPANTFLFFEAGPSEEIRLQWATYYDASDESGISRIYGGIHVRADDGPGRIIGSEIGQAAWTRAQDFFSGAAGDEARSAGFVAR